MLISLAQEVRDPIRHPPEPGVRVSSTDFKRLIEAYIAVELAGSVAEDVRKHARSALDLTLRLQHLRTAICRDAAICVEGYSTVVGSLPSCRAGETRPSEDQFSPIAAPQQLNLNLGTIEHRLFRSELLQVNLDNLLNSS